MGVGLTTPPWKKNVIKTEEATAGRTLLEQRRLAEASEEGQGPQRAVEPMMMMI
jgi:hypothetical protein